MNHLHQKSLRTQVSTRLKARRVALGLSQRKCASQANVSTRYLIQAEAGQANLSLDKLIAICGVLSLSLSEVVSQGERGQLDSLLAQLSSQQLREVSTLVMQRFPMLRAPQGELHAEGHIALLGVRGAGKSTIGQRLATVLNRPFVEVDREIEHLADLQLADIFSLHGEPYYRKLETEVLNRLLKAEPPIILATGGSIVTSPVSFTLLQQHSETIWLKATAEALWERVTQQGDRRPMKDHPHAMAALRGLVEERAPLYAQATLTINTEGHESDEIIQLILDQMRSVDR